MAPCAATHVVFAVAGATFWSVELGGEYNRGPELTTSAMRRLFLAPCVHFYDDNLVLGTSVERSSGQLCYRFLCWICGVKLDPEKHADMRPGFIFTGCFCNCWDIFACGRMQFSPKKGRGESIKASIHQLIAENRCPAADAATLRGKTSFAGSQRTGRAMRGCERSLIKRETRDQSFAVTVELRTCFDFISLALNLLPHRTVQMESAASNLILLYSDAEFQEDVPWAIAS